MYFFFQAEDGIRDRNVTGVQTCALPIWEVHEFPKSENSVPLDRLFHLRSIDDRAGMFKRSSRNTGWKYILDIKLRPFCGLHHIIQPSDSADIDNLMRIRNDRWSPVRNKKTSDLFRTYISRFNMNMAVDKSRRRIPAPGIDHFFSLIVADSCNLVSADGNVSLYYFSRK